MTPTIGSDGFGVTSVLSRSHDKVQCRRSRDGGLLCAASGDTFNMLRLLRSAVGQDCPATPRHHNARSSSRSCQFGAILTSLAAGPPIPTEVPSTRFRRHRATFCRIRKWCQRRQYLPAPDIASTLIFSSEASQPSPPLAVHFSAASDAIAHSPSDILSSFQRTAGLCHNRELRLMPPAQLRSILREG